MGKGSLLSEWSLIDPLSKPAGILRPTESACKKSHRRTAA
jgi:hypothetical protein